MAEIITTFQLKDLDEPVPMNRDEFYDGQIELSKAGKKPTRSAAIVQVLLFTKDGDLILQKRSKTKRHNPRLLDKSMGGHIQFGDSAHKTVLKEMLEELSVPSFVLHSKEEFEDTYKMLNQHVGKAAFMYQLDTRTAPFTKIFDGEEITIASTYHLYLGVFSGGVAPADREAAGMIYLDIETLAEELKETPEQFTNDVKYYLDKYDREITAFIASIRKA